jgi:transcriptional regulator with XRE-family HTH domain
MSQSMSPSSNDVAFSILVGGVQCLIVTAADYEALRERASTTNAAPAPAGNETGAPAGNATGAPASHETGGKSRKIARGQERELGRRLREAGLTQRELAGRLARSQSMVSQSECGRARISARYVRAVLAACGLAPTWGAAGTRADEPGTVHNGADSEARDALELDENDADHASAAHSGWEDLLRSDVVGIDPETFEPVRKGSPRDLELREKLAWWKRRSDP